MALRKRNKALDTARDLLQRFSVTQVPVPVDKIAQGLGAEIRYSPLDHEISGLIYISRNKPIIGVNALHHKNRQRFSIAHECGHLALHRNRLRIGGYVHVDKTFPVLRRDAESALGTNPIEIEANIFASELLMPRKFLEIQLAQAVFDVDDEKFIADLARKFQVSRRAMEIRIGNFLDPWRP